MAWFKNKKFLIITAVSVIGVLFFLAISYWLYNCLVIDKSFKQSTLGREVTISTSTQSVYFSQLDGSKIHNKEKQIPNIIGVVVDNHPDARPQSGLSQARVIYEALVEGGMTRYLVIFSQEQKVAKVGPVRSARPYFIDWIKEYGRCSLYMFCGGSPQALSMVDSAGIMAANQFYWDDYYWRDNLLLAPHNLFTSSNLWQKLSGNFTIVSSSTWQGWKFGVNSTSSENITSITLPFSDYYEVVWKYDQASSSYERYLDGIKQFDRESKIINADNVVVQFTAVQLLDEFGRLQIDTSGGGEARVFKKGSVVRGTWKKDSVDNRTKFYNKDGQEIILAPGKTWVEVLPSNAVIEVEN